MVSVVRALYVMMLLVWACAADAAIYYVDAAIGIDTNNGTSEETPFRTVKKGVQSLVAPGDTALIKNGTYQESGQIRFLQSGTQANPIRLANYPGHSPILEFPVDAVTATNTILLQRSPGHNLPIAWIIIEGFTIKRGWSGIKGYNTTNCTFRNLTFVDPYRDAILLDSSIDTVIDRNIVISAGMPGFAHGFYLTGSRLVITRNIIYDQEKYGVQMRGIMTYDPVDHAGPDYASSKDGIIAGNVFAYGREGSGVVVWGTNDDNMRIENNIFYENWQGGPSSFPSGINCSGCTGSTGVLIRNNHFYASGSGGLQPLFGSWVEGVNYTLSGNVMNVSPPGFVNGGADSLPVTPDFSLTSTSPAIGIARANEFPSNPTLAAGAFSTVGTPTASITTNVITLTFPMNTDVPIQVPSATGLSVTCTPSPTACPGSPSVSTAFRADGTDTKVDVVINGIASDACLAGQQWKISYNSTSGSWTTYANIGAYPGKQQKIFSFTDTLAANNCTGSSPNTYPTGYLLFLKLNDGTGTNANDESANNLDGTLANGASWEAGHSGSGMATASGTTQKLDIPFGNGHNPSTGDLTVAFGVNVPSGTENSIRYEFGPSHGTSQRGYVSSKDGTWRMAVQGTTATAAGASNLAVTAGWNHLCLTYNSTTDTVQLYKNGIAGIGGATLSYTSYSFASNFVLGRVDANNASGGVYDDLIIYTSLQSCPAIYAAFQADTLPSASMLAQAAFQFEGVHLDTTGNVRKFGALNGTQDMVANGGGAVEFQVHCQNISDCDPAAFRLVYAKNQTAAAAAAAGTLLPVPNTETADGIWMWGSASSGMNTGATTTRLTGTCAVTNGSTQVTSAQVPIVDLPQDGCVMLRYIVRVGDVAGNFYELRLQEQGGTALSGGYVDARLTVVPPRASAF